MRFFWGDERCVPPDHPQSNYGQARRALLDQVPAPAENIHRVRGEWEPSAAAEDYVRQLRESANPGEAWPRFDWVFLGLGADGHTASLFPGSPLPTASDAPALAVTADYEGRPAQRVTLTPQVLNAARVVAFLVTGRNKADAVAATLTGPRDPRRWPAQRINPGVGELLWWLDQAAAAALPANPRKAWDGIGGFNSLLMMADSNDLLPQIQTNFAQAPHGLRWQRESGPSGVISATAPRVALSSTPAHPRCPWGMASSPCHSQRSSVFCCGPVEWQQFQM